MTINKAIEKLEKLKEAICILPDELIEEEINRTINDLKSIEKVTGEEVSKVKLIEGTDLVVFSSLINRIEEINQRIFGKEK